MIELIPYKEISQILLKFGWCDGDIHTIDYEDNDTICPNISIDVSMNDVIVQSCLTHIYTTQSDLALIYVPNTYIKNTKKNLLRSFVYVTQLGERNGYALFQVSSPREKIFDYYKEAIKNKKIHFVFYDSWVNHALIPKKNSLLDQYVRYIPDISQKHNNFSINMSTDPLIHYISEFKPPSLINIPAVFPQETIENYNLFDFLYSLGYEITFSGILNKNNEFISETLGLYLK